MSFLTVDLANLLVETRKKGSVVLRKACDELGAKLSELKIKYKGDENAIFEELAMSDCTVRPFLTATTEFRGNKDVISVVVTALQHIVSNRTLSEQTIPQFIVTLRNVSQYPEDILLLKVVQICLSLITTPSLRPRDSNLYNIVSLIFYLYSSHSSLVASTAGIAIRQLSATLFDPSGEVTSSNIDMERYFCDICILASKESTPRFFVSRDQKRSIPTTFCLDVLDDITHSFPSVFVERKPLQTILKEQLCPLLVDIIHAEGSMAQNQKYLSFPLLIRALRLLLTFSFNFTSFMQKEIVKLISRAIDLVSLVDHQRHTSVFWIVEVVFEFLSQLTSSKDTIITFVEKFDTGVDGAIISRIGAVSSSFLSGFLSSSSSSTGSVGAAAAGGNPSQHGGSSSSSSCLENPTSVAISAGIPMLNVHQLPYLDMRAETTVPHILSSSTSNLSNIMMSSSSSSGGSASSHSSHLNSYISTHRSGRYSLEVCLNIIEPISSFAASANKNLLFAAMNQVSASTHMIARSILSSSSSLYVSDEVVQEVLRYLQRLITSASDFGVKGERDSYLRLISSVVIRDSRFSLQCTMSLLNIAHALFSEFDAHAWEIVLNTFSIWIAKHPPSATKTTRSLYHPNPAEDDHSISTPTKPIVSTFASTPLNRKKTASGSSSSSSSSSPYSSSSEQIVNETLDGLFSRSSELSVDKLMGLLMALKIVTINSIYSTQNTTEKAKGQKMTFSSSSASISTSKTTTTSEDVFSLSSAATKSQPELQQSSSSSSQQPQQHHHRPSHPSSSSSPATTTGGDPPTESLIAIADFGITCLRQLLQNLSNSVLLPVWCVVVDFVSSVLKLNPPVPTDSRIESIDAVFDLLGLVFSREISLNEEEHGNILKKKTTKEEREALENEFLSALPRIYEQSSASTDVLLHIINRLLLLLQSHGHHISNGWIIVCDMLRCIVKPCASLPSPTTALVSSGFEILTLMTTDFLSVLPRNSLPAFVALVGDFSSQPKLVNIALAAVNLLWNVADFFAKMLLDDEESGESISSIDLWLAFFSQMKSLTLDSRPEVRNSALHSLLSAMIVHGKKFDHSIWKPFLFSVLLPLFDSVVLSHSTATTNQINSSLGTVRGEDVPLLLHHSRNSSQKQWEETLALMINVSVKIVRGMVAMGERGKSESESGGGEESEEARSSTTRFYLLLLPEPSLAGGDTDSKIVSRCSSSSSFYEQLNSRLLSCIDTPSSEVATSAMMNFFELHDVLLSLVPFGSTIDDLQSSSSSSSFGDILWKLWESGWTSFVETVSRVSCVRDCFPHAVGIDSLAQLFKELSSSSSSSSLVGSVTMAAPPALSATSATSENGGGGGVSSSLSKFGDKSWTMMLGSSMCVINNGYGKERVLIASSELWSNLLQLEQQRRSETFFIVSDSVFADYFGYHLALLSQVVCDYVKQDRIDSEGGGGNKGWKGKEIRMLSNVLKLLEDHILRLVEASIIREAASDCSSVFPSVAILISDLLILCLKSSLTDVRHVGVVLFGMIGNGSLWMSLLASDLPLLMKIWDRVFSGLSEFVFGIWAKERVSPNDEFVESISTLPTLSKSWIQTLLFSTSTSTSTNLMNEETTHGIVQPWLQFVLSGCEWNVRPVMAIPSPTSSSLKSAAGVHLNMFVSNCFSALNDLCQICDGEIDEENKSQRVAVVRLLFPGYIQKIGILFRSYREEMQLRGELPYPEECEQHIVSVLGLISALRIHPSIVKFEKDMSLSSSSTSSWIPHLVLLYNDLCNMILIAPLPVRKMILDCLIQVGSSLKIGEEMKLISG